MDNNRVCADAIIPNKKPLPLVFTGNGGLLAFLTDAQAGKRHTPSQSDRAGRVAECSDAAAAPRHWEDTAKTP
jgi:hypothetical protein